MHWDEFDTTKFICHPVFNFKRPRFLQVESINRKVGEIMLLFLYIICFHTDRYGTCCPNQMQMLRFVDLRKQILYFDPKEDATTN